ncbi:MAG: hypothetical protein JXR65_06885 [Bacteroidales bacterium]|nr:hypothetical protein [Bacteroidales bacterium]
MNHNTIPPEVKPENKISIQGSSNISDFTLSLEFNQNELKSTTKLPDCSAKDYRVLNLPVSDFSYSNPLMKKDFYHLIDAKNYPFIRIYYPPDMLEKETDKNSQECNLIVEIRNSCQKYTVPVKYSRISKNVYEVQGNLNVKLTDFHLQPKKYFFGLIKVNNNLKIDFYLYF